MTATSRGGLAAAALVRAASNRRACQRCAPAVTRSSPSPRTAASPLTTRRYSSAATAAADAAEPTSTGASSPAEPHRHGSGSSSTTTTAPTPLPAAAAHAAAGDYIVKAGLLLSRAPLLTRAPTAFESAFWFYQKRLRERLSLRFSAAFYFKPDTAGRLDWDAKTAERRGEPAKELGAYSGRDRADPAGEGRLPWLDELRVVADKKEVVVAGSEEGEGGEEVKKRSLSDPASAVGAILDDAVLRVSEDGKDVAPADRVAVERPLGRETDADRAGDERRLDRRLDRTLYLLVQGKKGAVTRRWEEGAAGEEEGEQDVWGFPVAEVKVGEGLHETAARALKEAAGVNMNTWVVGRVPVAHFVNPAVYAADGTLRARGEKVFFLRARIMTGQADLAAGDAAAGLTGFGWLTREELQERVGEKYFDEVSDAMADR